MPFVTVAFKSRLPYLKDPLFQFLIAGLNLELSVRSKTRIVLFQRGNWVTCWEVNPLILILLVRLVEIEKDGKYWYFYWGRWFIGSDYLIFNVILSHQKYHRISNPFTSSLNRQLSAEVNFLFSINICI